MTNSLRKWDFNLHIKALPRRTKKVVNQNLFKNSNFRFNSPFAEGQRAGQLFQTTVVPTHGIDVILLIAEYQLTVRCVGQTLRHKFKAATDLAATAAIGGPSTVDREKLTDP